MFNAYEESLRVPLVVSSPALFREPRESDALVSLVDVVPRSSAWPASRPTRRGFDGHDLGPVLRGERDGSATRCCSRTTTTRPGRRSRTRRGSPTGSAACGTRLEVRRLPRPERQVAPEYELYDLEADPDEALNLVDKATGVGRTVQARREALRLHGVLERLCAASGTMTPALPAAPGRTPVG